MKTSVLVGLIAIALVLVQISDDVLSSLSFPGATPAVYIGRVSVEKDSEASDRRRVRPFSLSL